MRWWSGHEGAPSPLRGGDLAKLAMIITFSYPLALCPCLASFHLGGTHLAAALKTRTAVACPGRITQPTPAPQASITARRSCRVFVLPPGLPDRAWLQQRMAQEPEQHHSPFDSSLFLPTLLSPASPPCPPSRRLSPRDVCFLSLS